MNDTRIVRGLKEKDTPVNNDFFFIGDSESGDMVRYILWDDMVALLSGGGSGLTHGQVMARISLGI